jgi:regulator of sirC expression with transglutaminase-like and TPR domain
MWRTIAEMQHLSAARQLYRSLIRRPDPLVPLAEAAMVIAWEDQGGQDPRPLLAELDAMARAAAPQVCEAPSPTTQARALSAYLHGELGFNGDPDCYRNPNPANSYLDQVLARRSGLPILLSVVYLEVGWRLGLDVHGLALPGHFIVRLAHADGDVYVDPYGAGEIWSLADCERQIASFYGEISPEMTTMIMAPPGRGAILARILRNLKQTHLGRNDAALALAAVERLLLLEVSDPGELRDRGLLRLRVGRNYAAVEDLERYARENPAATDLGEIKGLVRDLVSRVAPRN